MLYINTFGRVNMKTYQTKKEERDNQWYLVNAEGKVLGRLATGLAARLRGKHKPIFTPHVDNGDFLVVINAEKVVLTGTKMKDKKYYNYSGYPGGLKEISAGKLLAKKPTELLKIAVKGMLPKTSLGRQMFKKLKVYAGSVHPHEAQKPAALDL
jgi:large subunit ribosomal protein L13